jgi:hypothetical protein
MVVRVTATVTTPPVARLYRRSLGVPPSIIGKMVVTSGDGITSLINEDVRGSGHLPLLLLAPDSLEQSDPRRGQLSNLGGWHQVSSDDKSEKIQNNLKLHVILGRV